MSAFHAYEDSDGTAAKSKSCVIGCFEIVIFLRGVFGVVVSLFPFDFVL